MTVKEKKQLTDYIEEMREKYLDIQMDNIKLRRENEERHHLTSQFYNQGKIDLCYQFYESLKGMLKFIDNEFTVTRF